MSAFLEARLADQISYGFQAVPSYMTRIVTLDNGREKRNVNWTKAKRRYTSQFMTFTDAQFALLLALFHAVQGSAYGFRFKDWTDYKATLESLGNTPGANMTPVQLIKTYTNGANSTVRTITRPVSGAVIYQGGVAKAGTLDTATGLFTPTTNWTAATALAWTGEFDVPVRFVSDELPSTYDDYKVIQSVIELVEVFGE